MSEFDQKVQELYGYSPEQFLNLHNHIQIFITAMVLQDMKIKMPDITPTKFGMSVYKRIISTTIYKYHGYIEIDRSRG